MKIFLIIPLVALFAGSCVSPAAKMPEVSLGSISAESQNQADAYYHFMNGGMLEQEGALDPALKEYETAFRLDPRSADIALALASLFLRRGKADDAALYAQKAVDLDPDNTEALMLLAGINSGKKKF